MASVCLFLRLFLAASKWVQRALSKHLLASFIRVLYHGMSDWVLGRHKHERWGREERGYYLRLFAFGVMNMRFLMVLYLELHEGDKLSLF